MHPGPFVHNTATPRSIRTGPTWVSLGGVATRPWSSRAKSPPARPAYPRTEPNSVLPIQFITASTAIEHSIVVAPSRYITERRSATPAGRVARRPSQPGLPRRQRFRASVKNV